MRADQVRDVCGTPSGYQAHQRNGETPCGPCRNALASYMREYRKRNSAKYADEKKLNAARSRAAWRLVELHRDEFRRLVIEELS